MQSYAKVVERHQREKLLEEPVLAAAQLGGTFIRDRVLQSSISVAHARRPALRRYSYDSGRLTTISSLSSGGGASVGFRNPFGDSQEDLGPAEARKTSLRSDVATENGKPRSVIIDIEPGSPLDSERNPKRDSGGTRPSPLDTLPVAVSSSTNLRSPTVTSFPHSVDDGGGDGEPRMYRRPKSHDWNR